MKPFIRAVGFILMLAGVASFAWCDAPPPPPATQPSATLDGGKLAYAPPDGWEMVQSASNDTTAAYISGDHLGILALQVLPANAVVNASAGPAIVRQLKANHTKAKQKMLTEPTIEKDARFLLVIHERYVDAQGNTNDELHVYQKAGRLGLMLTVNARTDDADAAKKTHGVGEDVLLSATAVKKK